MAKIEVSETEVLQRKVEVLTAMLVERDSTILNMRVLLRVLEDRGKLEADKSATSTVELNENTD